MDSAWIAVIGTMGGSVIGVAATALTQRTVSRSAREQREAEAQSRRSERLGLAYQDLSRWLTAIDHAVEDLHLKEMWAQGETELSKADRWGPIISKWRQGPLRMPDSVAGTRYLWSTTVRESVAQLETQIEDYVDVAFRRVGPAGVPGDEGSWTRHMYELRKSIAAATNQMMTVMRDELA